jgi:uracil-DNA glycosylase
MSGRFDKLIAALAAAEVSDRAHNQYTNEIRRNNLRLYLEELAAMGSDTILIGEAPSHRGGRLTGIAFVSETILLAGACGVLGADRGYRKATEGPHLSTEASATMVWSAIGKIQPLPLLWNAFPFHPFHPDKPLSNRVPDRAEILLGQPFIEEVLRLFGIRSVVAVGNQASKSLETLGIDHVKVRHPSMGGKREFLEGMEKVMAKKSQIQDIKEGRAMRERVYTGRNQPTSPKAPLPTKNAVKLSTVPASAEEKYNGGKDE